MVGGRSKGKDQPYNGGGGGGNPGRSVERCAWSSVARSVQVENHALIRRCSRVSNLSKGNM